MLLVILVVWNIVDCNAALKTQGGGQPCLQVVEVGARVPLGADDMYQLPFVEIEVDHPHTNCITQSKTARET